MARWGPPAVGQLLIGGHNLATRNVFSQFDFGGLADNLLPWNCLLGAMMYFRKQIEIENETFC